VIGGFFILRHHQQAISRKQDERYRNQWYMESNSFEKHTTPARFSPGITAGIKASRARKAMREAN
jgi:hypothetical protein